MDLADSLSDWVEARTFLKRFLDSTVGQFSNFIDSLCTLDQETPNLQFFKLVTITFFKNFMKFLQIV